MKIIGLMSLLLTITFGISAQISSQTVTSDLIVLQKNWRSTEVSPVNSLTVDNPFRANDDQREFSRATAQNMRENEVRTAQGLPRLPPPARNSSPSSSTDVHRVIIYVYEIKVTNTSQKAIRSVTWNYVFFDKSTNGEAGRRDFISTKKIAAGETKTLKENSYLYPTVTVDISKARKKFKDSYTEQIIVKKIEYVDGTVWNAPEN